MDKSTRFGVGFELKWLTHPDSAAEMRVFEAEIRKGVQRQARPALQWMSTQRHDLAQRVGLGPQGFNGISFASAVLIRPAFGTGLTYDPDIPIFNADLFESMINMIGPNLRTIWAVAQSGSFLPREGEHFLREDTSYRFGDVQFIAKRFGVRTRKSWSLQVALEAVLSRGS